MASLLTRKIRTALAAVADPAKAPQMQAYMKSEMPYHGVPSPAFKVACRELFAAYAPVDAAAWQRDVLAVWREAKFREERYAAIALTKTMLAWSKSPDMWKRRTSIICQLKRRDETDLDLLYSCIEPSLDSKEFFLRKAIGWALRQLAWTNPDEVIRYVEANEARLSGLSRREALKNVDAAGARPRKSEKARGTSSPRRART